MLKEAPSSLSWYEAELVPGLLQTEGYARAVISADKPDTDPAEIDRRVQLRIERQTLIRRKAAPLALRVVLNESTARRPVGGREVMSEHLQALAAAADLPNVKLRVVPFTAGLHYGGMSGPFMLLRFRPSATGATVSRRLYTWTDSLEICTRTSPPKSSTTPMLSRRSGPPQPARPAPPA